MAWLSSPIIKSSQEFSPLPEETQTFLNKVPSYKFITNSIPFAVHAFPPNAEIITFSAVVMNAQLTGSIALSSNPLLLFFLVALRSEEGSQACTNSKSRKEKLPRKRLLQSMISREGETQNYPF
jgi:hypothetical protein